MSWKFSRSLLIPGALAFGLSPTSQTSFLKPEALCRAYFISLLTWYFLSQTSAAYNHSAYTANGNIFQQDVAPC